MHLKALTQQLLVSMQGEAPLEAFPAGTAMMGTTE